LVNYWRISSYISLNQAKPTLNLLDQWTNKTNKSVGSVWMIDALPDVPHQLHFRVDHPSFCATELL